MPYTKKKIEEERILFVTYGGKFEKTELDLILN